MLFLVKEQIKLILFIGDDSQGGRHHKVWQSAVQSKRVVFGEILQASIDGVSREKHN